MLKDLDQAKMILSVGISQLVFHEMLLDILQTYEGS